VKLGRALCLLFGFALLLGGSPSVSSAQDAPKPGKSARARRVAPPKTRKKHGRNRATRNDTAIASAVDAPGSEPPAAARRKADKTRGRSEARAAHAAAPSEPAQSAAALAAQQSAAGVNAQIVKEGDTSVKVMEFTGLGIEGRLKSPQLVYFVQRVRAEFERPELPHRSFMPELEASSAREPVR
jgi:hypothetical protein